MKSQLSVQYALLCLQELSQSEPTLLSQVEISRRRGIPGDICLDILQKLHQAGIVSMTEDRKFRLVRPLEEVTSFDVIQAVWTDYVKTTPFRVLYQRAPSGTRKTLEAAAFAQHVGAFPGEGA